MVSICIGYWFIRMSDQYFLPCFMLIGNLSRWSKLLEDDMVTIYVWGGTLNISLEICIMRDGRAYYNIPSIGECRCRIVSEMSYGWFDGCSQHSIWYLGNPLKFSTFLCHPTHIIWNVDCNHQIIHMTSQTLFCICTHQYLEVVVSPSISHDTNLEWYVQCATPHINCHMSSSNNLDHLDRFTNKHETRQEVLVWHSINQYLCKLKHLNQKR